MCVCENLVQNVIQLVVISKYKAFYISHPYRFANIDFKFLHKVIISALFISRFQRIKYSTRIYFINPEIMRDIINHGGISTENAKSKDILLCTFPYTVTLLTECCIKHSVYDLWVLNGHLYFTVPWIINHRHFEDLEMWYQTCFRRIRWQSLILDSANIRGIKMSFIRGEKCLNLAHQ